MTEFVDPDEFTEEERRLLAAKVKRGSEVDPVPRIPDAPDISPQPKSRVPGTLKNTVGGLRKLKPSELPVVGKHFVVWGSKLLDDIRPRPVLKATNVTEDAYAERMRDEADQLVKLGLKNPPGGLRFAATRQDRAEQYARWRYKGHAAGEILSL